MWSITVLLLLCTKNVYITAAPKNISSQDLDKEVKNKQWSFDTNILICKPCECGVGYPGSRIVGGAEAKENEYPWMVSLWNAKKKFFCGGSIITDQYVLTAAHCFSEDPASNFREIYVMLGHTKRPDRLILGYSNVIKASLVKLHHNYDPEGISIHDNDIALVKLAKPVKFDQTLRTLCLPKKRLDYSGLSGVVAGWGQISETSSTSLNLRRATVPIWSEKDCSVIPEYEKPGYTSNMLCAGYKNGGIDSCQGDSGGPLMVYDNNDKTTVAGIVSWGIGCGAPKLPGVYTRVDNYIDWIMKHTKDSCHCSN